MKRTYVLIAILTAVSGALLISIGTANANVPSVTADCQTGLTASAHSYAGTTNTVVITFDGQPVSLPKTFGESFTFTKPNPDKTVPHTYTVDIVGSDNQASLHQADTIPACEETPPPTTVPPVTTTTPSPPVFIVVPPPSPPITITVVTPPPATPVVTTARFTG